MKIRCSQTMGEAVPLPGALFHFTFSVSLQWVGGFADGETPVPSGPRHCGQVASAVVPQPTLREPILRRPQLRRPIVPCFSCFEFSDCWTSCCSAAPVYTGGWLRYSFAPAVATHGAQGSGD